MIRLSFFLLLSALITLPTYAAQGGRHKGGGGGSPAITGITLSNNTFPGGSSSGTVVGAITVQETIQPFTGVITLVTSGGSCSGGDTSHFQILGSGPWNLATNGIVAAGPYTVCIQAGQTGIVGSPFTQTESITGIAQTIASVTVSGSSTAASFASNTSGAVVGPVVVTMSPASPAFSGVISLDAGGNNTEGFTLSGSTSGSNLLAPAGSLSSLMMILRPLMATTGSGLAPGTYTDVVVRAHQGSLTDLTINPTLTATSTATISGVSLSNGTAFTTPASPGSTIDTLTANCSVGSCAGATFALATTGACSGASSNSSFAISGSNLNIGGSTVNAGTYPIGIAVTLAGASNSGTCYAQSLVGTNAGSQTLASIALSNSATTTGLSSGTAVGTLSVTMSAPTPIFAHYTSGGLTLTPTVGGCNGADNASFQIVNDQLETNGTLTAGTKNICVAATQAGAIGSPLKQNFSVTVGNLIDAAAGVGTGGCTGSGTSGSPWNYLCIQNAVNTAVTGDTVFLRGGNWQLHTDNDATWVSITKSINLVGVASGNTLDAYGHINNGSGTTQCPVSGSSITCIRQAGNTPATGSFANKGFLRVGVDGGAAPNCVNVGVSHIFFDGSTSSAGGDFQGILSIESCPGPVTVSDIRALTYGFTGSSTSCPGPITTCANTETQIFAQGNTNLLVQNSFLGLPLYQGVYQAGQAFESVIDNGITLKNNLFWGGVYNPTDDDSVVFTGNVTDMSGQGGNVSLSPAFGPTGCGLNPGNIGGHQCGGNNGNTGTFHATFSNNYNLDSNAAHPGFGFGPGVNDPTTNGNVSDVHYTGNWLVGGTVAITTCEWDIFPEHGNCASGGMSVNAQATGVSPNECSVFTSNGDAFAITNNSIIGSTAAEINAQPSGTTRCYSTSGAQDVTLKAFGFNAQKNYLNSPSNQYNTNANAVSPVQSGNFCVGGVGTVSGCATSGFTSLPTASFTLNPLGLSNIVPFNTTTFTAQYGAVKWLSSTSPTTPTSGGQAGTGASWSFTPPVSLSATHGDTVYMWTMDSANNISTVASVLIP